MKDRRKNLYCGPEHKMIPKLEALANWLKVIKDTSDEINMMNYGGHKVLISKSAGCAMAEVDNLIRIDIQEVEDDKKVTKR